MKIDGKPDGAVPPTAPKPARSEPRLFDIARMAAAFTQRRGGSGPHEELKTSA